LKLVIVAVAVATVASQAPPVETKCKFHFDKHYYDLSAMKKQPMMAYSVFDTTQHYQFNVCGAPVQCGMQSQSPACKSPSSPQQPQLSVGQFGTISQTQGGTSSKMIGGLTPNTQALTPLDVADVNWKTRHMPPFAPDTQGVKFVFPAFGAPPAAQQSAYGAQGGGAMPGYPPSPPGWPSPPPPSQQQSAYSSIYGPPPPPPGWPSPPPPYGGNPYGAQANPYGAQSNPYGAQAGGAGGAMGPHSNAGVTVIAICDPQAPAAMPMMFTQGQPYKDRMAGYLFVVGSKDACATSAPGEDVLGTGLSWGWLFIIILAASTVLYCGCGSAFKYKKLGVTGMEMLPQIEFWRDYPGLVKDGLAFTVAKIKACFRPGSGMAGSGGAGGGYSTV